MSPENANLRKSWNYLLGWNEIDCFKNEIFQNLLEFAFFRITQLTNLLTNVEFFSGGFKSAFKVSLAGKFDTSVELLLFFNHVLTRFANAIGQVSLSA